MKPRQLKLTWTDADGTPYHEAVLSPRAARQVLVEEWPWVQLYIDHARHPLHHLTYAAVARSKRAVYAEMKSSQVTIIPEP